MSYIGNSAQNQSFAPGIDYFNGDGSTTVFTLTRPLASASQALVFVANVPQNPSTAFTVSGNTLTFTSAPPAGTNNIWVEYTSLITNLMVPGQGTVTAQSLAPNALTPAGVSGQVNTATSYLDLPKGTTAQRPASPQPGNMRYNTSTNMTEIYSGVAWVTITAQTYVASYLLVAGGGGGGGATTSNYATGGGGAGGLLSGSSTFTPGTIYSVYVGAGGAAGANGSNSSFTGFSTAAVGGGSGGRSASSNAGASGGSGGGGGGDDPRPIAGGSGTAGQGYAGGVGGSWGNTFAGGGGGAGAVGGDGTSSGVAGNGGDGTASSITGSSTYYAGGGGGGSGYSGGTGTNSSGGNGGGGGGSGSGSGTAGTANTGGGGGGCRGGVGASSGAGGSGVVILSVPTANYSGTTTGSPTIITSGSNTVLKFTSSGSYTA